MATHDNDVPPTGGSDQTGAAGDDGFDRVIRRFARAHRTLLLRDPDPLPEFVAFRNAVLDALESAVTIGDTSRALAEVQKSKETAEAAHLLVMELEAFSASVERVPSATAPPEPAQRSWWKRALGI